MSNTTPPPGTVVLSADAIAAGIKDLAQRMAPEVSVNATCVALMNGAFVFAADLMRALYQEGVDPVFDALHLESYGDARQSQGRVRVRGDLSRSVAGHQVWVLDDVFDSGRTLAFAKAHILAQGAAEVKTVALVEKPWDGERPITPDYVAFMAPADFLGGYGMDEAGRGRGRPEIVTL